MAQFSPSPGPSASGAVPESVLAELGLPPDLVIGEGVALDLRPATFASRAMALMLDLFLQWSVLYALFYVFVLALGFLDSVTNTVDEALATAVGLSIMVGVLVIAPVTIETLSRGRSIGKLAAGLRVVRDDGGPVRFRQALVRSLVGFGEFYFSFGSVPLIASMVDSRGRRVGDMLAGTYVIRERAGGGQLSLVVMPPHLMGWARGADLGRIPDSLILAVRQFLQRAQRLHPTSRARLGAELARYLTGYVAPLPPVGTHPEAFLAATLAERRDRDLTRLRTEAANRLRREERRGRAPVLSAGSTALVSARVPPPKDPAGAPWPPSGRQYR